MSERLQQTLWILLCLVGAGLGAATVYLYRESQRLSALTEGVTERIVYTQVDSSGRPQLYTLVIRPDIGLAGHDPERKEAWPLIESDFGDAMPVCEPAQSTTDREPRIAFLRFERYPSSDSSADIGIPGGVYVISSDSSPVTFGLNAQEALRVSGSVPRVLAVAPAWSPDGSRLAFAGVEDLNRDGKYTADEAGIYVCNVQARPGPSDTSQQVTRVAAAYATGSRLLWSPVGMQLILQIEKPNVPVPVAHHLNLTSGELVSRDDATTVGCWSPQGHYIAAYSMIDRKVHILDNEGHEVDAFEGPSGFVVDMLWLPPMSIDTEDQGSLVVVSATQPNSSSGQLHLRNAASGTEQGWQSMTDEETTAAYPVASPDGRHIVCTLWKEHGSTTSGDLYLFTLGEAGGSATASSRGGEPRQLTSAPDMEILATWIPRRSR